MRGLFVTATDTGVGKTVLSAALLSARWVWAEPAPAIGLTMTFSVLRFANFAHTETAVVGAYVAFTLDVFNFCTIVALAIARRSWLFTTAGNES